MKTGLEGFFPIIKRWWPVLLWMGVIAYASTDAGSTGNTYHFFKPLLLWFDPTLQDPAIYKINLLVRKTAHVVQFAILAILIWRAHRQFNKPTRFRTLRGIGLVFVIAAAFSIGSETIQYFMKNRGATVADVFLNLSGAALGLVLFFGIRRLFQGIKAALAGSCIRDKAR